MDARDAGTAAAASVLIAPYSGAGCERQERRAREEEQAQGRTQREAEEPVAERSMKSLRRTPARRARGFMQRIAEPRQAALEAPRRARGGGEIEGRNT